MFLHHVKSKTSRAISCYIADFLNMKGDSLSRHHLEPPTTRRRGSLTGPATKVELDHIIPLLHDPYCAARSQGFGRLLHQDTNIEIAVNAMTTTYLRKRPMPQILLSPHVGSTAVPSTRQHQTLSPNHRPVRSAVGRLTPCFFSPR